MPSAAQVIANRATYLRKLTLLLDSFRKADITFRSLPKRFEEVDRARELLNHILFIERQFHEKNIILTAEDDGSPCVVSPDDTVSFETNITTALTAYETRLHSLFGDLLDHSTPSGGVFRLKYARERAKASGQFEGYAMFVDSRAAAVTLASLLDSGEHSSVCQQKLLKAVNASYTLEAPEIIGFGMRHEDEPWRRTTHVELRIFATDDRVEGFAISSARPSMNRYQDIPEAEFEKFQAWLKATA